MKTTTGAGWAALAAGALEASRKSKGRDLSFSSLIESYAKEVGVNSATLWRHVAAYKFWSAMRDQKMFGEIPDAQSIQTVVSSVYVMGLAKLAQSSPRATVQEFVQAIRDGHPLDASAFASAKPLARGRGAGAKALERMQSQPEFDLGLYVQSVMDRLPDWAVGFEDCMVKGYLLKSEASSVEPGAPDIAFYGLSSVGPVLGALHLAPSALNEAELLQCVDEAAQSGVCGQSWLLLSSNPSQAIQAQARTRGLGLMVGIDVGEGLELHTVLRPMVVGTEPAVRDGFVSALLANPGSIRVVGALGAPRVAMSLG